MKWWTEIEGDRKWEIKQQVEDLWRKIKHRKRWQKKPERPRKWRETSKERTMKHEIRSKNALETFCIILFILGTKLSHNQNFSFMRVLSDSFCWLFVCFVLFCFFWNCVFLWSFQAQISLKAKNATCKFGSQYTMNIYSYYWKNIHSPCNVQGQIKGGTGGMQPLYSLLFFFQRYSTWLCVGASSKKIAPNRVNWLWRSHFAPLLKGHIPWHTPCAHRCQNLSGLNLGVPS